MPSITKRLLARLRWAVLLCILIPLDARGGPVETWESQAPQDPFVGTGDLAWTGDVTAWAVTTATWPTAPAQDFAGVRSLRSANHGSINGGDTAVETVLTNVSGEIDFSKPMEWGVFFSGNSATINTSRRADFILLADVPDAGTVENPDGILNGYKLTLWDPLSDAVSNIPPSSHEGSTSGDTLTLWRVDDTDDRWRQVGSIALAGVDDLREGWNLRARRDPDGTWSIGMASGAIGQTPALTSLGVDPDPPDLANFVVAYSGVGWSAPNNTTNDHTDFGFDNFSVAAVPEPTGIALSIAGLAILFVARLAKRGRRGLV
jgi:hypothetical protein